MVQGAIGRVELTHYEPYFVYWGLESYRFVKELERVQISGEPGSLFEIAAYLQVRCLPVAELLVDRR